MIYENKQILISFSTLIILLVGVLAIFDFGLLMKAFIGTVILGLMVFARALISAEVVPPEVDIDTDDFEEVKADTTIFPATSTSSINSVLKQSENHNSEHLGE